MYRETGVSYRNCPTHVGVEAQGTDAPLKEGLEGTEFQPGAYIIRPGRAAILQAIGCFHRASPYSKILAGFVVTGLMILRF